MYGRIFMTGSCIGNTNFTSLKCRIASYSFHDQTVSLKFAPAINHVVEKSCYERGTVRSRLFFNEVTVLCRSLLPDTHLETLYFCRISKRRPGRCGRRERTPGLAALLRYAERFKDLTPPSTNTTIVVFFPTCSTSVS